VAATRNYADLTVQARGASVTLGSVAELVPRLARSCLSNVETEMAKLLRTKLARAFAAALMALSWSPSAIAQSDSAIRILKSMSDFIAKHDSIGIEFDADIEVITQDLQKIQFTSSGSVELNRPDKLRATRVGGYAQVDLVFDGKVATVHSKDDNVFTKLEAPGTIDQLIAQLRADHSITAPGADLLLSNVFDDLMEDVIDAKHIGVGIIDGVECEHLAFRTHEVDWQIWVEIGEKPIPRKYVITSKSVAAGPQYTLRIKKWSIDTPRSAETFTFQTPTEAKEVAALDFPRVDEVPPGVVMGGVK
jgi:hypothetical protein